MASSARCREHPGFPPADMETLGIIVITPEPWQNNAAAVLARGSRLLTLYIDPKFLTEDRDWAFLASCLAWARSRAPILAANCVPLGGDPLAREPYGFAHGLGGRSILGLRNPFEGDARISFTLDRSVGLDDAAMEGTVIFEVRVDGKTAFRSEPLRRGVPAIPVRVSIRGSRTLELVALDGGDGIGGDHLDIAEARLERAP